MIDDRNVKFFLLKSKHSISHQVPVPSVSSGVHEAVKNTDKTETLFSQERDPRFAEMYTGISSCTKRVIHATMETLLLLFFSNLTNALLLCLAGDKKMMVPSSTAGGQQLYSQSSPFQQGHSGKGFG